LRARGTHFRVIADHFRAAPLPPRCDARAEQRVDKLRPDSHVPTTTPVQPLPAWFPVSTAPWSLVAWRTPIACGRRCRTSLTRRLEQACEDNALASSPLCVRSMRSWPLPPYPVASLLSVVVRARPALPRPALASTTLHLSRPFPAGHGYKKVPLRDHLSKPPPPSCPLNHHRRFPASTPTAHR
jgi:hypothetical protein